MSKGRILITGASGFIGQHLIQDIDPNNMDIFLMTRKNNLENFHELNKSRYNIIKGDLQDKDSLISAFKDIDIIVNLAAEVRNPLSLYNTNVKGTENLITAVKINRVSKIIHLSSSGVVGMRFNNKLTMVDEETFCNPSNEYERTKYESEEILLNARNENHFKLDIIRPTNVFGENHPFNALLNLMNHINNKSPVFNSKDAMVNYVYVKDVTALIIQLISSNNEIGIVNIGHGESLNDFYSMIGKMLQVKLMHFNIPQFLFDLLNLLNMTKLIAVSNKVVFSDDKLATFFEYKYGLGKGLYNTFQYYKNHNLIK